MRAARPPTENGQVIALGAKTGRPTSHILGAGGLQGGQRPGPAAFVAQANARSRRRHGSRPVGRRPGSTSGPSVTTSVSRL